MDEQTYFLSDGLNIYGPFEKDKIMQMLRGHQIGRSIHCRSIDSDEWTPLNMHSDFPEAKLYSSGTSPTGVVVGLISDGLTDDASAGLNSPSSGGAIEGLPDWVGDLNQFNDSHRQEKLARRKESISNSKSSWTEQSEDIWEMKIGNTILGPYKFLKMLKLIKMGDLREYDLVRKTSEKKWHEAVKMFEFSTDFLVTIDDPVVKELLERKVFRRQLNRKDYRGSVSVFDGKDLFHLECADLSLGGVAFFSSPSLFSSQQILLIRFENVPLAAGYHAKAQVVRTEKVLVGNDNPIYLYRYAVQYLEMTPDTKNWIKRFLSER